MNCFACDHQRSLPGDCHIACANTAARVTGDPYGTKRGWFFWPFNFDPTWLRSCDGFKAETSARGAKGGAE